MNHFITKCSACGITMGQCRCPSPDKDIRLSTCKSCELISHIPQMPLEDIKRQCEILGDKLLYPGNQLLWLIRRLYKCESALRQVYTVTMTNEPEANEDAYNYLKEYGIKRL